MTGACEENGQLVMVSGLLGRQAPLRNIGISNPHLLAYHGLLKIEMDTFAKGVFHDMQVLLCHHL